MGRYDEIMAAVCRDADDRTIYGPLVRKAVTLEEKLEYLESLPHIVVHPKDPTKQKTTPAFKQYKEALQQYGNIIRILSRTTGGENEQEDSPLRSWARAREARNADTAGA